MHHPLHPRTQAFAHTDTEASQYRAAANRLRTAGEAAQGRYYRLVGVEEGFPTQGPADPCECCS